MSNKILIIGAIVLIVAFGGIFYYQYDKSMQPTEKDINVKQPIQANKNVQTAAPADTDIDKALNELENMASSEGTAANEEDDAAVITEDSQAVSDIGQTYDEKSF